MVKVNEQNIHEIVEKSLPGFVTPLGTIEVDTSGRLFEVKDFTSDYDYDEVNEEPEIGD